MTEDDDPLFDCDAFDLAHRMLDDADTEPERPEDFGPYHFIEREPLGAGALGDVWLADEPEAKRRVAVKFLRRLSHPELAANEIQNQGILEHKFVARLYTYGRLPDGTPWLAMEYVDGKPLDEFCRAKNCSFAQRLSLFHAVCEAVQFAHSAKIDHGDLKPSNILVKENGEPKLLDFGLARRLQLTEGALAETSVVLGLTPAYAAPEQFRGESSGFRTDVYSLGVILYELLAGEQPFDASKHDFAAIETLKASAAAPNPPSVAAKLSAGESRVSKSQWRDLDALCLKAMDSDVNRRYVSVESLLQDLDRYRRCEPLAARLPHTHGYRAGKFLRRNRTPVVAAFVVFLLIAGIITFFTVRLTRERNRAIAEAARTQRVEEFLVNLFQGGDNEAGPSQDLKVVTILDDGVQQAQALTSDPAMQADLYQTLGTVYESLGQLDRADSLLESALKVRRSLSGNDSEETADTLVKLGALRQDEGRLAEAEQLFRDALVIVHRRLPQERQDANDATLLLGRTLAQEGKNDQAIQVLEPVVKQLSAKGPSKGLSATLTLLANAYFYKGDYAHADSVNQQALAMDQKLYGEHHPDLADDYINLGGVQIQWGHYPDAEKYFRQALEINQRYYGKDSVQAADAATYVGQALEFEGRESDAKDLLKQALPVLERTYGKVHVRVAIALGELGKVEQGLGNLDGAEADFEREFEIFQSVNGNKHRNTATALSNLGSVYAVRKQFTKAEQTFRDVIQRFSGIVAAGSLDIGLARIKLGDALLGEKHYAESESELVVGYEIVGKASPSSTWSKTARQDLIAVYEALNQPEKAATFRGEVPTAGK